jgi:hypothetical protein
MFDPFQLNLFVDAIIMLYSLMIFHYSYGFILFKVNMMCLLVLLNLKH